MNDDNKIQETTEDVEKSKLTVLIDKSVIQEMKLQALKKSIPLKDLVQKILKDYIKKENDNNGKKRKTNRKSKIK